MKSKKLHILTIVLAMFVFNGCLVEEPEDIYGFIETEDNNGDNGYNSVDFYGTPRGPLAGETVYFTNTSGGTLDNFYWDFGDGNVSYSTNPSHVYSENGVYDVSLTGFYDNGESVTETKYEYIVVGYSSDVTAGFYADKTSVEVGEMISFTSTSTGPVDNYEWDFGDGATIVGYYSDPTHSYSSEGVYTVSLTVYDPGSDQDTETKYDYIVVESGGGGSNTYCESYGGTVDEWIQSVSFGSFYNYSGNDGGYGDYTNKTIYLDPASYAYLEITPGYSGSSFTEYINIWIDYNNDGDFTDSGELIAQGYGSGVVTGDIYIDGVAAGTTTRMRISMSYGQYREPCEIFQYGEVEDYTVTILVKKSEDITTNNIKTPVKLKPKNGDYTIRSK